LYSLKKCFKFFIKCLQTEIKHRINQIRKTINASNSIWWQKDITKNRKLYIYQTIIQSILMYGAEVWQIPYKRNKQDFSYRNGCAKEISKEIKVRKNKK
jgi:hypothetical protein